MSDVLGPLGDALDRAAASVDFWWRDDDTGLDDPRLDGLLQLAGDLELPLVLAVVPAWLAPPTVARIERWSNVTVFQHGWAHVDHARDGQRKIELGGEIDLARLSAQLRQGRAILEEAFGAQFVPIMVPPWNRIDSVVERVLPDLGYRAVSTTAGRAAEATQAAFHYDIHMDVMTWRPVPAMLSLEVLASELAQRVRAMQAGDETRETIGLMTHHQVTDSAGMTALRDFLAALSRHPKARFIDPRQLLDG